MTWGPVPGAATARPSADRRESGGTSCRCDALHIDGAEQSGSGTIVRGAAVLAALTGTPIHVVNARARRSRPGLRAQHATAVRACAEMCGGETEGVHVESREFRFLPGTSVRGGVRAWDIGTAGSATMLALTVLPLAMWAESALDARITGGLFQDFAPSPFHLSRVLIPTLARMGAEAELIIRRPGYPPRGGGAVDLRVRPLRSRLRPFVARERGRIGRVEGIALASHLAGRQVCDRMARACERDLAAAGHPGRIERVDDAEAAGPGACLAAWTCDAPFGADRAGARNRSAEAIGAWVAARLVEELSSDATVDRHLADMLIPFAALAAGQTEYRVPLVTEHVLTGLWLVERFGATAALDGRRVRIQGIGREPGSARRPATSGGIA